MDTSEIRKTDLSLGEKFVKRAFDIAFALIGIILFGWIILIAYLLASFSTGQSGFFTQERIGRHGKIFKVIKIRTMLNDNSINTTITTADDPRITKTGHFFRKWKVDELPQLFNILVAHMSFVGPRPDTPGFADQLQGEDRIILNIRPGITGPATLKYRDEEFLLSKQPDPERYNLEIIFPDKVRINKKYIEQYGFWKDIQYILQTFIK